jgi:ribonuclease D
VTARAEELHLPQENLLAPDTVRRLCWQPPRARTEPEVVSAMRALGAREWQIEQTAALLTDALATPAPAE